MAEEWFRFKNPVTPQNVAASSLHHRLLPVLGDGARNDNVIHTRSVFQLHGAVHARDNVNPFLVTHKLTPETVVDG